jgi:hypothetical protein
LSADNEIFGPVYAPISFGNGCTLGGDGLADGGDSDGGADGVTDVSSGIVDDSDLDFLEKKLPNVFGCASALNVSTF